MRVFEGLAVVPVLLALRLLLSFSWKIGFSSAHNNVEAKPIIDESHTNEIFLFFEEILQSRKDLAPKQKEFVRKCSTGDADAIYTAAREISTHDSPVFGVKSEERAIQLYVYAANVQDHALSQAKLGRMYADGSNGLPQSTSRALYYFQRAGENGHHASLYNAGLILFNATTPPDLVGALAHFQAAAVLHRHYPELADIKLTEIATQAHSVVCAAASKADLSIRDLADVFVFGFLQDLDPQVEALWRETVSALLAFNETYVNTNGAVRDVQQMVKVKQSLTTIVDKHSDKLSNLQIYLALDNLIDVLGPLAAMDDSYLPDAARYAEAFASTPLCWLHYAKIESDSACFNGAASSAMSYYRRAGDTVGAERVLELANSHPDASTHWRSSIQAPRVFHPHITSKPWWDASEFSAARNLKAMYKDKNVKKEILSELKAVIALNEDNLRGKGKAEVHPDGSIAAFPDEQLIGFQRIFTRYIGVRTDESIAQKGAGGWAEFGPLFDGKAWSEERCKVVPTICAALRDDPSLCSAARTSRRQSPQGTGAAAAFVPDATRSATAATGASHSDVWDLCGSEAVVTLLRLRPGTAILPHYGTTNTRLIMHFPLIGAEGIKFVVGDETVLNYGDGDGSPIVFDDSYEHHVYHEGEQDRFIVLAVLGHPGKLE